MRERWMMECDVWWMRNEGMLLIESHCWIEWDEWERREEEIDFEDWEEKWLFWERDWVCYLWNENEHMDGCCWGDGLMMICMIDIDELSVCLCFHPQWERERERERERDLYQDWMKSYWKWLSIGIDKWVNDF